MHGQPRHTAQVGCSALPDVVIVATKVLVRELAHQYKDDSKNVAPSAKCSMVLGLLVTHNESVAPLPAAVVHGVPSV